MKRILVVSYSRSGHTRQVAEAIARLCDADLEWITERGDRSGRLGYLRSALQALVHWCPAILQTRRKPSQYALVIIGTPVWAWNMSSPVRSFLERDGLGCRRLAFFCTYGGGGADKVLANMQQLCGRRAIATLALRQRQVEAGQLDDAVGGFVRRFNGRRGDTVAGARLVA